MLIMYGFLAIASAERRRQNGVCRRQFLSFGAFALLRGVGPWCGAALALRHPYAGHGGAGAHQRRRVVPVWAPHAAKAAVRARSTAGTARRIRLRRMTLPQLLVHLHQGIAAGARTSCHQ